MEIAARANPARSKIDLSHPFRKKIRNGWGAQLHCNYELNQ